MITLHEVYEKGSEAVKAAVLAFGNRHRALGAAPDAEPDWEWAEQHFTRLVETIMGAAVPSRNTPADTVRRAENEAVHFLLAVSTRSSYRCPICARRQPPAMSPRTILETS